MKSLLDKVAVTGISGNFPNSNGVREFRDNLLAGLDLISEDDRRWSKFHPEIPQRSGKIDGVDTFDLGFFGASKKAGAIMDPVLRIGLEKVHEAMVDSGHHPRDFEEVKTGVYVAICWLDSEMFMLQNKSKNAEAIANSTKMMLANAISYYFKLDGVAFLVDSVCSSSLYAFDAAYRDIKKGNCDKAIVCGLNVCLHPNATLQFARGSSHYNKMERLGVLSPDGSCKSFDDAANGYVRSEAVVALILERASEAMRVYAEIVHSKTNCDGFKQEGITYPSSEMQKVLLRELYEECMVDPKSVAFVEAHGTGTKVGDPAELDALEEIFCKGREKPLYVGSVKSNIGHDESASGLCSIVKVIVGMESGFIPPNINYSSPRKGVKGLEEGRLKVVTEKTPWPEDDVFVGVNSFGFGGANSHVLLHWNTKEKKIGRPRSEMPTLICISGRTEEAIINILEEISTRKIDEEMIKLVHQVYRKPIPNNPYQGYMIWTEGRGKEIERCLCKKSVVAKKLCVAFTGFGKSIDILHNSLKVIPKYLARFNEIHRMIEELNFPANGMEKYITQLALAVLIKDLNISAVPQAVGFGRYLNTITAFFNDTITLNEAILALPNEDNSKVRCITSNKNQKETNVTFLVIGDDDNKIKAPKIQLVNLNHPDFLTQFLRSLGKLSLDGFCMDVSQLYPEINVPVSRGTPMLSPLIQWDHRHQFEFFKYSPVKKNLAWQSIAHISVKDVEWSYVTGHVIDGRNLFPATGYLLLAWKGLCSYLAKNFTETTVVFEDVKFLRAATVPANGTLSLKVTVFQGNGSFFISEEDVVLVTGKVHCSDSEVIRIEERSTQEDQEVFMDQSDVYKELRLRGYNYQNEFKAIKRCSVHGKTATITWNDNWTTFMDNMMQLSLLQQDCRNLYVPTSIKRVVIDANKHRKIAVSHNNEITVYVQEERDVISGGGIEITSFGASVITRRKLAEPILETYKFVPNKGKLRQDQAVRCMVQTILENSNTTKVKAVEVLKNNDDHPIMPLIQQTLGDLPLIQPELKVISKNKNLDLPGITVEDVSFEAELPCHILVLSNQEFLSEALKVIREVSGFVITKGSLNKIPAEVQVISSYEIEKGTISLLKESSEYIQRIPIDISSIDDLSWVERLRGLMRKKILLYSQNFPINGVLGLVNCLRKESVGNNVSAMIIMDGSAPPFNITKDFFKSQLEKNLAINVFKEGTWGSYRHLLLSASGEVEVEHCYVNVTTRGDLSSLKWIEGPLTVETAPDPVKKLVHVHYSAINFRDVMTASAKLSADTITPNRVLQECIQGFEFSGILAKDHSERVMGMVVSGALSTMVEADSKFLWPIPNGWSLEAAATVPVVYGTVLYAFITRGRMRRGQSVLIHSGTGGVGQAAINVASHLGCTVFVTVGTEEKREFIKRNFPQIKEAHIGDSRSTTFEQMILKETGGRGVDFVLNSLAEEKLLASVRCLAYNGTFLEIGKFDLASDNQLSAAFLRKQARYEGIMLDQLFSGADENKEVLSRLMKEGILNGSVKPLICTIFPSDKVEEAYRFMTTGKHIGKVLVKIRGEESFEQSELFKGIPRVSCDPSACYVIIGGLGGFGLELADWLVIRGAKNLVLTSRSGVKNGYQSYRLNIFKAYNVRVSVRSDNIGTETGCYSLLNFAETLGPVNGIFNLAVVLKDALFENQTVKNFRTSLMPKAYATRHLDLVSRKICPRLKYFVVFSSVSCGRGNAGQTNYGMANSVMERVCEKRKADGFPALAIQWGAVGDLGLVAEMQENHKEVVIGGTLQQKISNCLQVLDRLLRQDEPVVSSMVVADKKSSSSSNNVLDDVLNIFGVRNLKTVSLHAILPELGMDSMMGVEIKQTLEREYEIFLTAQDIRNMTLAKLQTLTNNKKEEEEELGRSAWKDGIPQDLKTIFNQFDDTNFSNEPMVELHTLSRRYFVNSPKIFALPGIEGMGSVFKPLSRKLNLNISCFQFSPNNQVDTIELLANDFVRVTENIPGDFNILAYSFGCTVAIELMHLLESRGKVGKAFFIDGSPEFVVRLAKTYLPYEDEKMLETSMLSVFMSRYISFEDTLKHKVDIHKQGTLDAKIRYALKTLPSSGLLDDLLTDAWKAAFFRVKAGINYQIKDRKLKSKILLAKPTKRSLMEISDDYELSSVTFEPVLVKVFEGNHTTILENDDLAEEINNFFKRC